MLVTYQQFPTTESQGWFQIVLTAIFKNSYDINVRQLPVNYIKTIHVAQEQLTSVIFNVIFKSFVISYFITNHYVIRKLKVHEVWFQTLFDIDLKCYFDNIFGNIMVAPPVFTME